MCDLFFYSYLLFGLNTNKETVILIAQKNNMLKIISFSNFDFNTSEFAEKLFE